MHAIYARLRGRPIVAEITPELRHILDRQFGTPMAQRLDPQRLTRLADTPTPTVGTTEATVLSETNNMLDQALNDLMANAGQSTKVGGVPPEVLTRWTNELVGDLNTVKTMAWRAGVAARDFTLLDYTNRRAIDPLLGTFLVYPFWGTRSYPNCSSGTLQHPAVVASALRFMRYNRERNKDLPEWAQDLVRLDVPGLPEPVYANVRSIVDPLYQLFSNMENEALGTTALGRAVQRVDASGYSVHPLITYLLAAERALSGKPEEARDIIGHAAGATRAVRYATGLLGLNEGRGVTPEFWLLAQWHWRRRGQVRDAQSAGGHCQHGAARRYHQ
jgi:hypothetical protein